MTGEALARFEPAWQHVLMSAQAATDAGESPGVAVSASVDGSRRCLAFGVSDISSGRPMRPSTILQIGSITKLLVAMGVLRLVELGKVDLDEPVAAHVEFAFSDPEASHLITPRHLMSHSSGVSSDAVSEGQADIAAPSVADYVASFRNVVMVDRPGSQFRYCSPGWVLLAHLIERVTGRPWADVIHAEVLAPGALDVDLDGTSIHDERHASGHVRDQDRGYLPIRPRPYPVGMRPSGGAHASVETLLALARSLLPSRGVRRRGPLSDATLAMMQEPAVPTPGQPPGGTSAWGLAWARYEWAGEPVFAQGGLVFGQNTLVMIHVPTDSAVAVAANCGDAVAAVENIARAFIGHVVGIEIPCFAR